MEQQSDLTQQFIAKKYLVDKGVADILLYPEPLFKFLNRHKLLRFFNNTERLEKACFLNAHEDHPEYPSAIMEYRGGSLIKQASVQVMLDSLLREEHLCPVRIMRNSDRYEMLLAPLSESNISLLDRFYNMYRIDIARAYRVRRDVLNKPFSSRDLPDCLATLFIRQNALYEQSASKVEGIVVSDDSFNPDATILAESPENLARLFRKQ